MDKELDNKVIDQFKNLYADGFRCIKYEFGENDSSFTLYLKDFHRESSKVLKYNTEEGAVLKKYIDGL